MEDSPDKPDGQAIDIYYKKTRHHRTSYVDGVWIGITPQLEVQLAFFKDLQPMPDYVTHAVLPEGGLGAERARVTQKGIVREVEVTLVMSGDTLENVINLTQQFLEKLKTHQASIEALAQATEAGGGQ
jgi:hypothetical protein